MLLTIGTKVRHTPEAARAALPVDPVNRHKLMMLCGAIEEFLPRGFVMVRFDGGVPVRIPLHHLELV